jgi:TetR/AcrR family transcriptional regulator, acrAB operon repressor
MFATPAMKGFDQRRQESGMVRRTREEAAATREALLDAAEREFRSKGVAHTTLADVADAAGVTRGAIYWHFRDKAELFEAMCERAAMPMEAMLGCAGGRSCADPLGTLRDMAVMGLTRLARDARTQAVFDVMFHKCEFTADLAPVAQRQRTADEGCRRQVMELLERAISRRQLPADTDARLAAELLKAFMVGVMHEWVQNPAAYDLERIAPVMIDTVLAGLATSPPRTANRRKTTPRSARAAN